MTTTTASTEDCEEVVGALLAPTPADDPYPLYNQLRDAAPVFHSEATGLVLLTSRSAVDQFLRWSSIGQGPEDANRLRLHPKFDESRYLQAVAEGIMFTDPPKHTRLRKLVARAFTPKSVGDSMGYVEHLVTKVLDEIEEKVEFDLVADLGERIPIEVISHILGIPEADRRDLVHWTHEVSAASNPVVTDEMFAIAEQAAVKFTDYAAALATERRANPGDDVISRMVTAMDDGDALSPKEFATQLMTLIAAGTETVVSLISSSAVNLALHPDQREILRADPSLDRGAIEEFLRYDPPLQMTFPRLALEDIQIDGIDIAKGTPMIGLLAAANRDPEAFDDPDTLDVRREFDAPANNMSFGGGIHVCLGAHVARLESRTVMRGLLDRFPDLQVDLDHLERGGNNMIRSLASAPARTRS
jgi:cytochrome P450